MTSYGRREKRVKKALSPILKNEAEWEVLVDLLRRRGMRQTFVERRRELGLTQAEVALRMDISQPTLSEMETEDWPNPRVTTLFRWALVLELDLHMSVKDILPPEQPEEEETAEES